MPSGVGEAIANMPDANNRPYHFVDMDLIGDVKIQLDIVTPAVFFAGSLQEIILSVEFARVPLEVQEMLKHLSFLAHLMIKHDDFHTVYRLHTKLMAEFYSHNKSWDDTKYLKTLHKNLITLLETGCNADNSDHSNVHNMHNFSENQDFDELNHDYKEEESPFMDIIDENMVPKCEVILDCSSTGENEGGDSKDGSNVVKPENNSLSSSLARKRPRGQSHVSKSTKSNQQKSPKSPKKRKSQGGVKKGKHVKSDDLVKAEVKDGPMSDSNAKGAEISIFCPKCNKDVMVREGETLKRHMREHHPITFTCPHCNFSRKSPITIEKHMEEAHPDEKEVKILCPHCGEVSTTFRAHVSHVKRVHINTTLHCPNCPATFTMEYRLRIHKKSAHNIVDPELEKKSESKSVICPFCGKLIKDLPHHIYCQHKEHKLQKCLLCDYTSQKPSAVKLHIKRFHNKPQVCSKCNKTFKSLDRHLRNCGIPTEERRKFSCEYCGKSFTSSNHLKRHVNNIHQKAKDRECPHCHYRTTNNFNLDNHIKRVHEGKHLKTECHFCGKQVFNLDFHVKTYHQEELLSSSGYSFQSLSELKMVEDLE